MKRLQPSSVPTIWRKKDKGRFRADKHDTILSHATGSRQAYDMIYDCRSVLKRVLKGYDIFSDVHNNRKSCRRPVAESLSHATKIVPCKSALKSRLLQAVTVEW